MKHLALSIYLAFASLIVAGDPPAWLETIAPTVPGAIGPVEPCELKYRLSWSGVLTAGENTITVGASDDPENPGMLIGESWGKSKGLARLLYEYDYHYSSVINPKTMMPKVFRGKETDKKDTLWTTNFYSSKGVDNKAVRRYTGKEEKHERKREFPFGNSHDLMSAILYLRSLPLEDGDVIPLLVHPFSSGYVVTFTVEKREKHRTGLGKFDCIKLDLTIKGIDRDEFELKEYDRLRTATIWVTDDEYRMPLEIRAEIFVGSVRAALVERKFLNEEKEEK